MGLAEVRGVGSRGSRWGWPAGRGVWRGSLAPPQDRPNSTSQSFARGERIMAVEPMRIPITAYDDAPVLPSLLQTYRRRVRRERRLGYTALAVVAVGLAWFATALL